MDNFKLPYLIIALVTLAKCIHCELTGVVETEKGPVQGEIRTTIRYNVKFSSFRGIPYGKPPVGRARFMPPEEVESWSGVFDATSEATPCPQLDFIHTNNYIGNEDCLNLNVYTPRTNFNDKSNDSLLAVMVWLYGGQYRNGYTNITYFGPDYLIENNVVVVTINFRLSALGYFALNLPNATGNAALKDQRLAFEWVKRNIKVFGGNPNMVTIFGESTGGAAVDFHVISDVSRGLFHQSISMSSSALCSWVSETTSEMETNAFYLGRLLGIYTNDTQQLLMSMYDIPAENIIRAASKISSNLRPFKPTIENPDIAGKSAFLTECALNSYRSGKFSHLPHMTGFLASEALRFMTSLQALKSISGIINQQSSLIMADIPENVIDILSNITGGLPQNIAGVVIDKLIQETISNLTEILYSIPIDSKRKFMQRFSPVYHYEISIAPDASYHKLMHTGILMNGAAHGDDVPYIWHMPIFKYPTSLNNPFVITRDRMTRMWTNFAKYSNPTPFGLSDQLLNVTWPVSGPSGNHLDIDQILSVGESTTDPIVEKLQAAFIENLEKFSGCT